MRRFAKVALATAALALVAGVAVKAQSLGEVAARTQKEKEAKAKPAKVFTESDLRKPQSAGSVSQPGSTAVSADAVPAASPVPGASPAPGSSVDGKPAEASPKPKTPEEERAELSTAWRERLAKAQEKATIAADTVSQLQNALNENTTSVYSPARAKMTGRLEDAQKELAAANQAVADIQEEGRRAGLR